MSIISYQLCFQGWEASNSKWKTVKFSLKIYNTFFLFTTQMIYYFHSVWSNQHVSAKSCNPIYIAQDEKKN